MKKFALTGSAFVCLLFFALTGRAEEVLNNQSIVKMTSEKLDVALILKVIAASPTKFDTSVNSLIELKKQGVDERVLNAMFEHNNQTAPATAAPTATKAATTNIDATNSVCPSAEGFYARSLSGSWEKMNQALMVGMSSNMGKPTNPFKGKTTGMQIKGSESSIKVGARPQFCMVDKDAERHANSMIVVKLAKRGNDRELTMQSRSALGRVNNAQESAAELKVEKTSPGQVLLKSKDDIESGEYAVVFPNVGMLTFDFSVRQ